MARPWLVGHRVARRFRRRARADEFRILLFHDLGPDRLPALARLVAHAKRRHGILTPEQVQRRLAGERSDPLAAADGRAPCLLSFDDGFASAIPIAREVLGPLGVRALFFVCPGLIDLSGENQRLAIAANVHDGRMAARALPRDLRLMTWDEVAELRSMGHTVGAHGMTHRRLSRLHGAELKREIVLAGERIRERLACEVRWYAYAFGDAGSISRPALALIADGFRYCRSGVRGANSGRTPAPALRADHVPLDAPFAYQTLILEGGLDMRYRAERRRLDGLIVDQARPATDQADSNRSLSKG